MSEFLYLLIYKATGEYIYLDGNGDVAFTTDPTGLVYTPDGWQKKAIAWERDLKKWGLVRTFTVPLGFVEDGATLVKKISVDEGCETEIELLIQQLALDIIDPTHHAWEYIDFYRGEIDLPKLEADEIRVTAPIIEGSLEKLLKANENTVYEIALDISNRVLMDGIYLFQSHKWLLVAGTYHYHKLLDFSFIQSEGQAAGFLSYSQSQQNPPSDYSTSDAFFAQVTQGIPIITMSGQVRAAVNIGESFTLKVVNQAGATVATLINAGPVATAGMQNYTFSASFAGLAGDKYFLLSEGSDILTQVAYEDAIITASFKSKYRSTYARAITAHELFKRLIEKITGSQSDCTSNLLATLPNIHITSGDAIRGIEGAKIKTSLSQFYEFCRAVCVAGQSVESNQIIIEELSHFTDVSFPQSTGEAKDLKWRFAEDLMFNSVKIGYNQKNTDDVNGKYAFNNSHLYTIKSAKKTVKQLDIISPYSSDPYFIEITRMNLEGKTTTDNSADNDVIILNVDVSTAAQEQFQAIKTTPEEYVPPGTVKYESVNGSPLITPSSDYSLFTYNGAVAQPVIIGGAITPQKTDGSNCSITVYRNADILTNQVVAANGGTVGLTPSSININPGDVIKVVVGYVGVGVLNVSVNQSTLYVIFTNVVQYDLLRVPYVNSDTGVPDISSLFNIEFLTPKRMLLRWMQYINSCMFQLVGEELTFETTEKNRDLKTDDGTTVIDEDADETIGVDKLFLAVYFDFENKVPELMAIDLQTNPNTGFDTVWNSDTWLGILIKGAMAVNTKEAQRFKLLAAPDFDVNLLKE